MDDALAKEILAALSAAEKSGGSLLQTVIKILARYAGGDDKAASTRSTTTPKGNGMGAGSSKANDNKHKDGRNNEVCKELDKSRYPKDSVGDVLQIVSNLCMGKGWLSRLWR